jgi:hypothetical protein
VVALSFRLLLITAISNFTSVLQDARLTYPFLIALFDALLLMFERLMSASKTISKCAKAVIRSKYSKNIVAERHCIDTQYF